MIYLDEIYQSKQKMIKDLNKINDRVSQLSGRDPDRNMNKGWGDWLATAQVTLEIADQAKKKRK